MNKIVVEHYPVERLPEDLREGFGRGDSVRVTVEADPPVAMTAAEVVATMKRRLADRDNAGVTVGEAVARIRALRDEWDD